MIGLLSDSHDRIDSIRKAVAFFNERRVSLVLHAGDVISPFTAKEFKELTAPLMISYGNNDGERKGLERAYAAIGAKTDDLIETEHAGRRIAVYHGTVPECLSALVGCQGYDVVVRGHTHRAEIKKEGKTLVVNPGECCGYLTGKETVALLDPAKMKAEIREI